MSLEDEVQDAGPESLTQDGIAVIAKETAIGKVVDWVWGLFCLLVVGWVVWALVSLAAEWLYYDYWDAPSSWTVMRDSHFWVFVIGSLFGLIVLPFLLEILALPGAFVEYTARLIGGKDDEEETEE